MESEVERYTDREMEKTWRCRERWTKRCREIMKGIGREIQRGRYG